MEFYLQLFIVSTLFGAYCSYLAQKNKKNPFLWFGIGFFFGILGLLFFLVQNLFHKKQKKSLSKLQIEKKKEEPSFLHSLSCYSEKMWYYVDTTNRQIGPISHNLFKKKIQEGILSTSSLVWNENLSEWKKLQELLPQELSTNSP